MKTFLVTNARKPLEQRKIWFATLIPSTKKQRVKMAQMNHIPLDIPYMDLTNVDVSDLLVMPLDPLN